LILLAAIAPSFWYILDFESDPDGEYPAVVRPTFSPFPPASYRIAEPGDTLDRLAIYAASATVLLSLIGWTRRGSRASLWPAALGVSLAAFWHAMTPGPCPDGWHGIGWRTILDGSAPRTLRLVLGLAALALGGLVAANVWWNRSRWRDLGRIGRTRGVNGLLLIAPLLVIARQGEIAGVGPAGYWPRWAFFWGLLAFDMALLRSLPTREPGSKSYLSRRFALPALLGCWVALIITGRGLLWFQRPIDRLRTVVPGRIYISGMPDPTGLRLAQERHGFRTIINLFPEDTPLRSPLLEAEERFARDHRMTYFRNSTFETDPDTFLDATLALARDPKNWPILVHCHACMDRTPAWMGIYRFVEQGRPLDEVLREIEQHRGLRPKASVSLMYASQLPRLAPERFASDPTGRLLQQCAAPAIATYRREPAVMSRQ
jgi:hypothetical protein